MIRFYRYKNTFLILITKIDQFCSINRKKAEIFLFFHYHKKKRRSFASSQPNIFPA